MPLASFISRVAAFAVDFLISGILFMLVMYFLIPIIVRLNWVELEADAVLNFSLKNWYSLVFVVIYFGLFTYFSNGRTPGKRLFGIRIVSLVHERMSLWHSFERALGYGASALEFGFGFIQYFIHPNRRTVHDRIAETIVITDRTAKKKKTR